MICIRVQSETEVENDRREGEHVTEAGDLLMFFEQTLRTIAAILAVVLTFAVTVHAQETTSSLTSSATSTVDVDRSLTQNPPAVGNFPRRQFAPMTRDERFRNYLSNVFGYEIILRATSSAGIQQANGTPKEWGGGANAYARRLGSRYGQHFVSGTFQYGISSVLHEDNRYFASGQTGTFQRIKYAIKSSVMARHDNGNQYFSFSRIGGTAAGAFISREWSPPSVRSPRHVAVNFGMSIGTGMGFNLFREFWPDLKRHL